MIQRFLLGLSFVLSLAACTPGSSNSGTNSGAGGQCSLQGTWERCDSSGGQSQKITLVVNGSALNETIEMFNSNTTCSGANDGQLDLDGVISLGVQGGSTAVAGATDADLTTTQDIGCGAGGTAYTVLKFSDDCEEFNNGASQPGCDANSRGSSLDLSNSFVKQ